MAAATGCAGFAGFSVLIDWVGAAIVIPMLPFLAKEFNADEAQLGTMMAAFQAATIPGGIIIGMISRSYGTKYGLLFSILGSGITFFFQALSWNYESLLVARIAAGLTGNSIPVALTYIGMKVPAELKPKYMSYVGLCITSSFVIGPLIGGSLSKCASYFTLNPTLELIPNPD